MKNRILMTLMACLFMAGSSPALQRPIGASDAVYFPLDVSTRTFRDFSSIDKFGVNYNISSGEADNDIWEFGGVYTYDSFGTAPVMYISSSSTADTNLTIIVDGLDIDGDLTSQTVTSDGQNAVTLTTPLWRVFRMENGSDAGNNVQGVLYCHTDPTPTGGVPSPTSATRAIINGANNQTLMALYTVPKGYVGYLFRGEIGVALEGNTAALAEYALVHYESRRLGKVFKVKKSITLMVGGGSALYQDVRSFPDIIPSLTDIRIRCKEATQDLGIWSTFDILLIEEDTFDVKYLQAIGQPGY